MVIKFLVQEFTFSRQQEVKIKNKGPLSRQDSINGDRLVIIILIILTIIGAIIFA